ncbi:UNVERIFIED_CONTAM: hypothetical protein Slati_0940200 [Sesamum latifolium]|uniref:Tf2-1-like SH3-like domain-containing protein n=1 Tax=Sesamum latifolium TaxID=2727402 RepID=A0AAW2XPR5_9LAMI
MKLYADKKISEREFEVGDEVFLKLQPYRQTSVSLKKRLKLSAKYFGPYRVIERVGKEAYKLELPPGSKIHSIFHVSLLKKKVGSKYFPSVNLPEFEDKIFKVYPVAILPMRLIPRNNVGVPQVLIQWSHASPTKLPRRITLLLLQDFQTLILKDKDPKTKGGMSHFRAKMRLLRWTVQLKRST